MRVIAGSRKSLVLKSVPGMGTRPTTDRIKETLFNMLNPYLADCRFLDLFAGSGGIGIEALSRGAAFCTFFEKEPKALAVIRENLQKTGFADVSEVLKKDAGKAGEVLAEKIPYDIVFMDPPYNKGLEHTAMQSLVGSKAVTEETLFVIEASLETDFSWVSELGLTVLKEKNYKTNKHMFLKLRA